MQIGSELNPQGELFEIINQHDIIQVNPIHWLNGFFIEYRHSDNDIFRIVCLLNVLLQCSFTQTRKMKFTHTTSSHELPVIGHTKTNLC